VTEAIRRYLDSKEGPLPWPLNRALRQFHTEYRTGSQDPSYPNTPAPLPSPVVAPMTEGTEHVERINTGPAGLDQSQLDGTRASAPTSTGPDQAIPPAADTDIEMGDAASTTEPMGRQPPWVGQVTGIGIGLLARGTRAGSEPLNRSLLTAPPRRGTSLQPGSD
jgi:hypothetical protein